jgi:hypothetical protein
MDGEKSIREKISAVKPSCGAECHRSEQQCAPGASSVPEEVISNRLDVSSNRLDSGRFLFVSNLFSAEGDECHETLDENPQHRIAGGFAL